ncbi:MAG: winged helix-turn-helix transcriptional regulator [Promethearchaeota archaeon]
MNKTIFHNRKFLITAILGLIIVNSAINFAFAQESDNGQFDNPPNKGKQKHLIGPGRSQFQYGNNLHLDITSNSNLSLDIIYDEDLANRMLGINFNSNTTMENNLTLAMEKSFAFSPSNQQKWEYNASIPSAQSKIYPQSMSSSQAIFGNQPIVSLVLEQENEPEYDMIYNYNAFYSLTFIEPVDSLKIFTENSLDLGIEIPSGAEPYWALFNNNSQSWEIISTQSNETEIYSDLLTENLDSDQFILTLIYLKPILHTEGLSGTLIAIIALGGIIAVSFGLLMTNEKYREYLLNRILSVNTGPHRLSMEQILENETRDDLIKIILENPGIHFNELLRKIGIAAGSLVWHLDILDTYKIIKKKRVGQYLTYYCYLYKNPLSNLNFKLSKSQTTLNILNFIQEHEGCFQSKIAKELKLNHKTVKYHLDKLEELGLLEIKLKGKRKIFTINKDYKFNSLESVA